MVTAVAGIAFSAITEIWLVTVAEIWLISIAEIVFIAIAEIARAIGVENQLAVITEVPPTVVVMGRSPIEVAALEIRQGN